MLEKIRFWLLAATVLAIAECASVTWIEITLPAAAEALSSGDQHFRSRRLRPQSGYFFHTLFGSFNSRQQRKPHQTSDSSHAPPQPKTKLKPERSEPPTSEKPVAHSIGSAIATIENVPLPRPRPAFWGKPQFYAEAAGPDFDTAGVTSAPSDCDQRLAPIAAIELLPRLIGPGDCGGRDMVELNAVLLPDHGRVEIKPAAVLRCAMAETFAAWVRDEASAHITKHGASLRGVEIYGSYECRGRNSVSDAKLSEHGKGNAIDMRALILADGRHIELADTAIAKPLFEELRDSACHRFTTVLGPGADSHHNGHVHFDILERNHGYRICQWDVREPPPSVQLARASVPLPMPRPAIACRYGKRRPC